MVHRIALVGLCLVAGCAEVDGLAPAMPASVTVKFDFDAKPLPDIPLPNDIATRPDDESLTGKRINASVLAPTHMESRVRNLIDGLDGWGEYQPITIPFTAPIDVQSIIMRHRDANYDTADDAIYLINIDRDSHEFGRIHHLDVGNGNYPIILERPDKYGDNDPRGWTINLPFDEEDEDLNGNGEMDPGEDGNHNGLLDADEDRNGNGVLDLPEDTDADGVLDKPNYLPGRFPDRNSLKDRADALMSFYERETNTLLVAPLTPLQEQTTYAVIVTRRILDMDGDPIGSPFAYINHTAQTDDLMPLLEVLPEGLDEEDIAFTFSYTTESITPDWIAVREGLYELGIQAHLGKEFPAEIKRMFQVKDVAPGAKFEGKSPWILNHEDWKQTLILAGSQLLDLDLNSQQASSLFGAHDYVDFHAMATYESPQLFNRYDADGKLLNLDLQSWPKELSLNEADTRAEEIPFWVVVPRKEVSARKDGKMVPLVLLGHGYGSNRVGELIGFSGFFAMFGAACISTDNVSHGLGLPADQQDLLRNLLTGAGLGPGAEAVMFTRGGEVDDNGDGMPDRHFQDLNRDGTIDSGVDFWTSYMFHTRDMMRQSAVDYMQLIRIIRTWDGTKTWDIDSNTNGVIGDDLAGDFDGDGFVDIGSESPLYVLGGSLGGIMATTLGALEPEVEGIVPIAGGGRLTDVGNRSMQGGVPDAVLMRIMGPTFLITLNDDGTSRIHSQVTSLNDLADIPIRTLVPPSGLYPDGTAGRDVTLQVGDTMVAENMINGERSCAYILPDAVADDGIAGRARVNLASDLDDPVQIKVWRGPVLETGSEECELIEDAGDPILDLSEMAAPLDAEGMPMLFEGVPIEPGKVRAFAEGLGLRRTTPEMRRFMSIAQMVLDPTDPGVLARHLSQQPFDYPNKGDRTGARFLIVTTTGDMNVPASSGITVGRAAGVIDYLNDDPRYGKPVNQVLLDTYSAEAVNTLQRFTYANPPDNPELLGLLGLDETLGVHLDVENFSGGEDIWGDNIPRLEQGLRLIMTKDMYGNDLGGYSGAIFPYAVPEGQHGFALPGEMTDKAMAICQLERGDTDPAACTATAIAGNTYDVGWSMFHLFGQYITQGHHMSPVGERCWSATACSNLPPPPAERTPDQLP
jgi:hypothetical protein